MIRARLLGSLLGSGLLASLSAPATAETQTYVDLRGGFGYSANPLLQLGPKTGSGFARVSAFGFQGWKSERSETSLSAFLESSLYFHRYGDQHIFDLSARTSRRASERLQVFGSLGFSGDFGGQLGTRFYGNDADIVPVDPTLPPPTSEIILDPDVAALTRRQYRLNGQVGATYVLSERDYLTTAAGAQKVFFSGNADEVDYQVFNMVSAWQRRLNERLMAGIRVTAEYGDYSGGRSIFTYGPQALVNWQLDQNLEFTGGIGFLRTERDFGNIEGKDKSIDVAFDASLCRNFALERFCGSVARRTQTSVLGAAPAATSINASYAKRLGEDNNLQLSVGIERIDGVRDLGVSRQTYYNAAASYDRKISDRLSAGASLSGRKLTVGGADPKADVSGFIFVRQRLGDLR